MIWSKIDPIDYGTAGGAFKNDRWARYLKPRIDLQSWESILKNLEFVFDLIKPTSRRDPDFIDRIVIQKVKLLIIRYRCKICVSSDIQDEGGTNQHS